MELRHLRYFVAVAETGSIRSAAERLHITQPAISRQIKDLEDTLKAPLFERHPTGLRLTLAGAAYLEDVQGILAELDAANRRARAIAAGAAGRLRVGFVENAVWNARVAGALNRFGQIAPAVALELQPMNTPEQLEAIEAGRLDGGFCYRVGNLPDGFSSVELIGQRVVLAVPEAWPLGRAGAATVAELAGVPFVTFPRRAYPAYYDALLAACVAQGLTLDIRQEAQTETAMLSLVSAGVGAALVNSANMDRPPSRVRFAELSAPLLTLRLEFCFRADNANAALGRFVECLG